MLNLHTIQINKSYMQKIQWNCYTELMVTLLVICPQYIFLTEIPGM